jgi:hypothetical protein
MQEIAISLQPSALGRAAWALPVAAGESFWLSLADG